MAIPLIEFGLSEFGTFEFGYEQGSLLVGADFKSFGQGDSNFKTQTVELLEATSSGSSQVGFISQTILLSEVLSNGDSSVNFNTSKLLNVDLKSSSQSDAYFNPLYVIDALMAGDGVGIFEAVASDPDTFTIRGIARVNFIANYASVGDMGANGKGVFQPDNFAYFNSKSQSTGSSSVSLKQGTWSVTDLKSFGEGSLKTFTQTTANSNLQSDGYAALNLRNQTVNLVKLNSDGRTSGDMRSQYLFNTGFMAEGTSTDSLKMSAVTAAVMQSMGISVVNIRPGSPVSEYLPPAWDIIYRPYENRGVIWK